MKDPNVEYNKVLRSLGNIYVKRAKILKLQVFPLVSDVNSIHEAIMYPEKTFEALMLYSVSKIENKIPLDDLAYTIALCIHHIPFLNNSSVGKKWLAYFDTYYTNALLRSPTLQQKTKDLYMRNILRIKNDIWQCKNKSVQCDTTLYIILHNPDQFFKDLDTYAAETKGRIAGEGRTIHNGLGQHAKDNLTSSLVALFIHNEKFRNDHYNTYEKWVSGQKTLRTPIQDKYLTNKPTQRQESGYVSFEEVIKKRNSLENGSYERLLLTLYTDIPPSRSDFHDTKIYTTPVDEATEGNYIVLLKTKATLILNNYKTAKKHGQNVIILPEETQKQLRISLKKNPRQHLFISTRFQKPYSELKNPEGSFNSWANKTLKSIFNEDFSLTMLRHIYISRRDLKLEEQSGTERNKIAKQMGHSVEQQGRYLWHSWLRSVKPTK